MKNIPSQVAQYATPRPKNSSSPGTFKCLWLDPVAKMIVLVKNSFSPASSDVINKGEFLVFKLKPSSVFSIDSITVFSRISQ